MTDVFWAHNQLFYFVCFFALFVTYFLHNVTATFSYDRKDILDIRTVITHFELDQDFFFNKSASKDIPLSRDQAQIPVIRVKKSWGALWEFVGEWVNRHYHPFYWPTCNHWGEK